MSKPIIEVEHLSKCYRIGAMREPYLSLREELTKKTRRVSSAFSGAFRKDQAGPSGSETDFWALNDVSFSVQEGEAVGIIGRNGAGKSTLLKILSQITPPTKGQITMRGRVASLLEVGTGFHPELTGRENIFLNGAILGMHREEIRRKFDEIVAFAEVERFLDTPVKRYSSGMYVRLAFAVAAHLEPEILLVDEVLAVGDAEFQKKCLGKMGDVAKEGRTVLFVSHNMSAVAGLCQSAVLLESGRVAVIGPAMTVINRYTLTTGSETSVALERLPHGGPGTFARLQMLSMFNDVGKPTSTFPMGGTAVMRVGVRCRKQMANFEVGIKISSWASVPVHYFVSAWEGMRCDLEEGDHFFEVTIPKIMLLPGKYLVGAWVLRAGNPADDHVQDITTIEVVGSDVNGHGAAFERYAHSGCEVYAPSQWNTIKMNTVRGEIK